MMLLGNMYICKINRNYSFQIPKAALVVNRKLNLRYSQSIKTPVKRTDKNGPSLLGRKNGQARIKERIEQNRLY